MKDLRELLQEIDLSREAVAHTLLVLGDVQPKGHRVAMIRGQLEAAQEVLLSARNHCMSGMTGSFQIPALPKK